MASSGSLYGKICMLWVIMLIQVTPTSATTEDQLLQHFHPTFNDVQLTKVANILNDMRSILADQRLQNGDNQIETTTLSPPIEHFSRAENDNISHAWTSPTERYLFEGDIVLTIPQASRIFDWAMKRKPSHQKRAAIISLNHMLWQTMPIHYVFHESLVDYQIQVIKEALEYWQNHTCVIFAELPQTTGELVGDAAVFYRGDGCYSMVGRAGGTQGISVGLQCTKAGLIAHEIGHVLGLWHEQSRPDSSSYIKIIQENILPGFQINFKLRPPTETQTYGLPYDLGSVMHYRSNAFSTDDQSHTIETIEPGYQRTIGQRATPSFIDVQAVNKAYCENRCRQPIQCFYGGYIHPSTCNRCLCPDGLGGTHCEMQAPSTNALCGGLLVVDHTWIDILSPNYPNPYGFNQKCSWLIKAQPGFRVRLEFDFFDISCNLITCIDYVELKLDNREFAKTGMRYCCNDAPSPVFSMFNEMLVIFNSEQHTRGGFKARVTQFPSHP